MAILDTIEKIRSNKALEIDVKRVILLDSLDPEHYLASEIDDLILDILYQIRAGVTVCLALKKDACLSVGANENGDYLVSFALTNAGTVMKADDTHTRWQITKISPQSPEFMRAITQYRLFADGASATHAYIYPNEYKETICQDQKRFAEFKERVCERMYKAARWQGE